MVIQLATGGKSGRCGIDGGHGSDVGFFTRQKLKIRQRAAE
jgi:hypothetical protein